MLQRPHQNLSARHLSALSLSAADFPLSLNCFSDSSPGKLPVIPLLPTLLCHIPTLKFSAAVPTFLKPIFLNLEKKKKILPFVPQVGIIHHLLLYIWYLTPGWNSTKLQHQQFLKGPSLSLTIWIMVVPQDQLKEENENRNWYLSPGPCQSRGHRQLQK